MPIQYVGGQTASVAASTATNTNITFSLTGGLASTPANGDLVVVAYSIGSTVARTPAINTAGYTQLTAQNQADTFDANLRVGYKRMGSTPDTQVQVGPTANTADSGFVTIHVFRGVDAVTPKDVTEVFAAAANSGVPDPGAVTPATAGNVIYVVGANGHGTTGTMTASYLSGFLTGQNIATTNRTTMGAGYVTGQAAGVSYNPAAFTWSANVNTQAWEAVTLVLRPGVDAATANDLESVSSVTSPVVTQTHSLLANGLQSASNVSTPVFTEVPSTVNLLANDLQSASNVSVPTVAQRHGLLANDLQSVSNVSRPTATYVPLNVSLLANDLQSQSTVQTVPVGQRHTLLANDLQSVSSVARPALSQTSVLLANDLQSTSSVTSPSMGVLTGKEPRYGQGIYGIARYATFQLSPSGLQSLSQLTRPELVPALVVDLFANDLQSASNVSRPSLGVIRNLLANDLQSASNVTRPAITQRHNVLANDLQSVSTVQSVNMVVTRNLLANDLQSVSTVQTSTIRQTHNLLANDLQSTSNVTRPAITQKHNVLANDLQSASNVSRPVVTQKQNLLADDLRSNSSVQTVNFGQRHALLANDLQSASNVTRPVVGQTHNVLANDLQSQSTLTQPVAAQVNILLANDLQSASTTTTSNLGQVHNLGADNLSSNSFTQTVNVSVVRNLLANDLSAESSVTSPRLVDILPAVQDTTRTVYVPQEVFTLYINSTISTTTATVLAEPKQSFVYQPVRDTTVYVQADNRKVYVGRNVA